MTKRRSRWPELPGAAGDILLRTHGAEAAPVQVRLPHRPERLHRLLVNADMNAAEWALVSSLALVSLPIAGLATIVLGPALGFSAVALGLFTPMVLLARWRSRRQIRLIDGLPAVLDDLARSLRAGRSLDAAIRTASQSQGVAARRLHAAASAIELGQPLDQACREIAQPGDPVEVRTAASLLVMTASGSRGAAQALEAGSRALAQRRALGLEVRALIAQSETSVRVLSVLPLAFVGIGVIVGQQGATALFTTSTGRVCLAVGLALDGVGVLWMRALVHRVRSR